MKWKWLTNTHDGMDVERPRHTQYSTGSRYTTPTGRGGIPQPTCDDPNTTCHLFPVHRTKEIQPQPLHPVCIRKLHSPNHPPPQINRSVSNPADTLAARMCDVCALWAVIPSRKSCNRPTTPRRRRTSRCVMHNRRLPQSRAVRMLCNWRCT